MVRHAVTCGESPHVAPQFCVRSSGETVMAKALRESLIEERRISHGCGDTTVTNNHTVCPETQVVHNSRRLAKCRIQRGRVDG